MHRITTFFILTFVFSIGLQAQTEITNASFPVPGDKLETKVAVQVDDSYVTAGGENQTWDFSALSGGIDQVIEYFPTTDAANDSLFPNASCVQFLGAGGGEQFFKTTAREFASLGIVGGNTTGLGFATNTIYDQPYVVRRAMTYDPSDVLTTEAVATLRLALDDLPAGLGDSLGNLSPVPFDSIGFGVSLSRRDEIDGWGKLTIPGETYDVLRETRREERNTIVEIKLPFFGWQDVSDLIGGLTGGAGNFINDTTYSHVYLSEAAKEPIAVVTLSDDMQSAVSVEYKDLGSSGTHIIIDDEIFAMTITPNPTLGPIQVVFEDLPQGDYQLGLYDLAGKLLANQSFSSAKNITLTESSHQLTSGIYFVNLKNAKGELLATEKLIIQ